MLNLEFATFIFGVDYKQSYFLTRLIEALGLDYESNHDSVELSISERAFSGTTHIFSKFACSKHAFAAFVRALAR